MLERVQAIAVSIAVGDPTYYKKGWYQNVIPPPFERPGNKSILKSRQVYAQENKGKAGQDPGQKNDWKQEQPLVVFIVVLLAGEQLAGIIDVIEIQVQGRRCRVLEMGNILPLFVCDRVSIDGAPVVAGYFTGGMLVHQRCFDDVAPAPGDVPLPLPADAVGHLFVERHCDGIAADQDGEYDRPFEPVDGIVGEHGGERLLDTQFQHLPPAVRSISCAHHTTFCGAPQGGMRFLLLHRMFSPDFCHFEWPGTPWRAC